MRIPKVGARAGPLDGQAHAALRMLELLAVWAATGFRRRRLRCRAVKRVPGGRQPEIPSVLEGRSRPVGGREAEQPQRFPGPNWRFVHGGTIALVAGPLPAAKIPLDRFKGPVDKKRVGRRATVSPTLTEHAVS